MKPQQWAENRWTFSVVALDLTGDEFDSVLMDVVRYPWAYFRATLSVRGNGDGSYHATIVNFSEEHSDD